MDEVAATPDLPDPAGTEDTIVELQPRLTAAERRALLAGTPSSRRAAGALLVAIGSLTVLVAVFWIPGHTAAYAVPPRPLLLTLLLSFAVSVANFFVYGRRSVYLPGLRTTLVWAVVLSALAALEIAWAIRYVRHAADAGYPDAVGPVTLIGAIVLIAGCVLAVAGRTPRVQRVPPAAWLVGAAVALATVLAGVVIAASANGWTVHSSPGPVGAVPPSPSGVERVVWSRTLAGAHVAAGGPGLIVARGDTLQGLAAGDGDEVWSYRRRGAQIHDIVTSPDGATLYVDLAEFDPDGRGTLVFDAVSGNLRFATNRRIDVGGSNVSDAGVVDAGTDANGELRVTSRPATADGQPWQWRSEKCASAGAPQLVVTADRVVVARHCGADAWTLTALDASTGDQAWEAQGTQGPGVRLGVNTGLGLVALTPVDAAGLPQFRRLSDGKTVPVDHRGYEAFGYLVATDERNVPTGIVDPRRGGEVVPLSAGLQPIVDRSGSVLTLDRQIVTAAGKAAALRAVDVSLVAVPSGRAAEVHTGLDPGDDVRLLSGPGAVYVVVHSANGDVGVAALA